MPGFKKENEAGFREKQKDLNDALREGRFTHFYILYGEQAYLKNQNRDKIRKELMREESGFGMSGNGTDSMNYTVYTGNGFTAKQVIETAETLPFFAERRVILFENTGLWKDRTMIAEADELADYFGSSPDTTYFIFSEPQIDRTRRLYKSMTAKRDGRIDATVLNMDEVSQQDILSWTATQFRKDGKAIGGGVLNLFFNYTGTDMLNILSEKDKLVSYVGEKPSIDAQDVRDICTPVVQDRIFDMIGAIAARDTGKAMNIYMDLLRLETAPQVILSLMTSQYSRMMQVKELAEHGMGADEIAAEMGLKSWVISKNYLPVCRGYRSAKEIEELYAKCVRANSEYKSGKISDYLAVEILIAGR